MRNAVAGWWWGGVKNEKGREREGKKEGEKGERLKRFREAGWEKEGEKKTIKKDERE